MTPLVVSHYLRWWCVSFTTLAVFCSTKHEFNRPNVSLTNDAARNKPCELVLEPNWCTQWTEFGISSHTFTQANYFSCRKRSL
ncbi:hypothetical protein GBAR_LOCUS26767 [Geodia barretti]|uniref:Secreted protein n=1 Tax=Geodia barretti TaxID=519541 RepID=A0AA35TIY3_GEOBA|nr:hypothetical protein GBAR_LOCUS26767 [Geodia barretti]